VNTLAARGIAGFTEMLQALRSSRAAQAQRAPRRARRDGVFLASDGAAAITGQVIYVDCGYQIMGM